MSFTSVRISDASAILEVHDQAMNHDGSEMVEELVQAFEACAREAQRVKVILIWVAGAEPSCATTASGAAGWQVRRLAEAALAVPQLLVGYGNGVLSAAGSELLAACDVSTASRSAELRLLRAGSQNLSMSAQEAKERGLLRHVADHVEDLAACFLRQGQLLLRLCPEELERLRARGTEPWQLEAPIEAPGTAPPPVAAAAPSGQHAGSAAYSAAAAHLVDASIRPETSTRTGCPQRSRAAQVMHKAPVTTLIIRHIPCSVTVHRLVAAIEDLGFAGRYDLVNLPMGGRPNAAKTSNLGYGFINFKSTADAVSFARSFNGYSFGDTSSQKVITVQPAKVQGLEEILQHVGRTKRGGRGCIVVSERPGAGVAS